MPYADKARRAEYHKEYERENHPDLIEKRRAWYRGTVSARREYMRAYNRLHRDEHLVRQKEYHRNSKERWIQILSERDMLRCSRCGYDRSYEALDFHHLDPSMKEIGICRLTRRVPTEQRLRELDKCIPLCSNCHRELHAGMWEVT